MGGRLGRSRRTGVMVLRDSRVRKRVGCKGKEIHGSKLVGEVGLYRNPRPRSTEEGKARPKEGKIGTGQKTGQKAKRGKIKREKEIQGDSMIEGKVNAGRRRKTPDYGTVLDTGVDEGLLDDKQRPTT
jgi:hypothetical protein